MTKAGLRELIANSENSYVEFDTEAISNHEMAKAVVAFANLQGGRLLLGVDDGGSVCGVARKTPFVDTAHDGEAGTYQHLKERVMQACREKIRPPITPWFEVLRDVEPGRDVAVVQVGCGWSVHHVWHEERRTCFMRIGRESGEASPGLLASLFQQRAADRPDRRPVSGTSIADLDRRRLEDYFARVREQEAPAVTPSDEWRRETAAWARNRDERHWRSLLDLREQEWRAAREDEWASLLVNTQLLDDSDRQPVTVAGLLLFGRDSSRYLPHARIDAAAYFGQEKNEDTRERRTLRGPIVRLNAVGGGVLEPGLVEQAVDFVRRNIETVAMENHLGRQVRWEYPQEAVREAIINAIVHREYLLSGAGIELSVYSDRLEVVSPGRLPNRVTPARMKSGFRCARNELLKDVMRDYCYLDPLGGIPRKIVRVMRAHNGTEPELIEEDDTFTLRLWKAASA